MTRAPRYKTILVAVDFSDPSVTAFERGVDLARRLGADIELLHVAQRFDPLLPFSARNRATVRRLQKEAFAAAEERMDEMAEGAGEVKVSTRVVSGRPSDEILAHAARTRADLIVVATRGHRALDAMLLGSTAERLGQRSTRPVLLVPGPLRKKR